MMFSRLLFLTILFSTHYLQVVVSKSKGISVCNKHKRCTDLDFENCGNKCSNEAEKRIVCYFTNWAWYRKGEGKFLPQNIDISLCTHINYAFAVLDNTTLTIKSSDPWADIDNNFFKQVTDLNIRAMISIGGWTNSGPEARWSDMMKTKESRKIFIDSVVKFIKHYNFCGLDVDYEYPACPQGNSSLGTPNDAKNFNRLISELKEEFKCHGSWDLSVTIAAGKSNLENCYCISELCSIADWINVMAYDYASFSDGYAEANSPICGTDSSWGLYETLGFLTGDAHCPASKLVLGMPFYGKSYTLADKCKHQFGANITGPGVAGEYTQEAGTLAYYEICRNKEQGWSTGWSESNGSYSWSGNQLVSYDDVIDIKRKCCLINKYYDLGGAMVWALDLDDFTGSCGCGTYPLLRIINLLLRCPH